MKIINYQSHLQPYFERLNRAWIEKYFTIEPTDLAMLQHPNECIIQKGGKIFFVDHENQIIGTVALVYVNRGVLELAKMAVDERFQGIGAGKLLCKTAIEEAKKMGADKLILVTNSQLETAITIYKKYGFTYTPIIDNIYQRADTKMQLILNHDTYKWFEREFEFNFGIEMFDTFLGNMKQHVALIKKILINRNDSILNFQAVGKWSIKEHVGHLWILEPLWQVRFQEIRDKKPAMSPADLNNLATDNAYFNQYSIEKILYEFEKERNNTIQLLNTFHDNDFNYSLFHPRLNQPMRIIDLMHFVAEHDLHHIQTISTIIENFSDYPSIK